MTEWKHFHLFRIGILALTVACFVFLASGNQWAQWITERPVLATTLNNILLALFVFIIVDFVQNGVQTRALRTLLVSIINGEPSIATTLALEQRRHFAKYWLGSISSDPLAKSALIAISERYLVSDKWRYRVSKGLRANIARLDADIVNPGGIAINFRSASYFRCTEHSTFSLPLFDYIFQRNQSINIIAPLSDLQLANAYTRSDCIFRNMIALDTHDQATLAKALDKLGTHKLPANEISSGYYSLLGGLVCGSLSVTLNTGVYRATLKEARYEIGSGIVLEYVAPFLHNATSTLVSSPLFDVTMSFIQSRHRQWFCESYNEPTLGSYYEIKYDQSLLTNVAVHEFLSLSRATPVHVVREPGLIRVHFEDQWIFPVSGVVVTWIDAELRHK